QKNWLPATSNGGRPLPGDYLCPDPRRAYENGAEPILSAAGLYRLDRNAILTVNDYDARVLNTSNLLIADVDFDHPQLSEHGRGPSSIEAVLKNLRNLSALDQFMKEVCHEETDLAGQSYRVYRTRNGCRVICTSQPFLYAEAGWDAEKFMRFMQGDPAYI